MKKKTNQKKKVVVREINIDLFESSVLIFWGCTTQEVHAWIKKRYSKFPEHILSWLKEEQQVQGVCLSSPGKSANCVIWLSKDPNERPDLLTHEITHAAYRIMDHWSIAIDDNAQEVLAMLTGYLIAKSLIV